MPKKKQGKERLDKYYHLAKDQGYRARSAFKLIQLAKKFDFLSKSRVCIDLCAAPGSWSQVAQRNMPSGSQILAIDLAPIKAIQGVTCIQSDITTEKCRAIIRKECKGVKADVVLHDGAPNVGATWSKDAYGQNELTLASLKVACEHLKPGGCFVSKVFRSADYNSLMWVFNQLFAKVDATKPTASRNVSAEIFVMCIQFKAGKIDPRFFDPKWVFMENLDPLDKDSMENYKKPGATMTDHFKNLQKRHRGGFDPDLEGGHLRIAPAIEFIKAKKPAELLIANHGLDLKAEGCEELANHPLTTDEVRDICKDLKVCGKRDLATLLKWRIMFLREKEKIERDARKALEKLQLAVKPKSAASILGAASKAASDAEPAAKRAKTATDGITQDVDDAIGAFLDGAEEPAEGDAGDEESADEDSEEAEEKINDELDDLVKKRRKEERIEAKKTANRQKKMEWRKKLSLNVHTAGQDEPELLRASSLRSIKALEEQDDYIDPAEASDEEEESSEEEESDSDEELDRHAKMEVDLAIAHALNKANTLEKFRSSEQRKMRAKKESRRERVHAAWAGELQAFNEALDVKAQQHYLVDNKQSSDEEDDEDSEEDNKDLKVIRQQQRASLFDNVDGDAMAASIGGPQLSTAAAELLKEQMRGVKKQPLAMEDEDEDEVGNAIHSSALVPAASSEDQLREQHRANRWFSQDIFKNLGASASSADAIIPLDRDSEEESDGEGKMIEMTDKDLPKMPLTDKEKRKLVRKREAEKLERLGKKPKAKDTRPMEVAPLEAPQRLDMTGPQKPSDPREYAETMALGSLLVDSKKSRMDLIDAAYNRYTFDGDEALPDWFTEDENKHNKPELPITKEMMDQWRAKMREINARPIRKVAEAKARKGRRLKLKLDKLRKTAMSLADTPDMSESAKARLMRKQVGKMMQSDQRAITTVAIMKGGGGNRAKSEKNKVPKGAKVKVVDNRMKSDVRSQKRAEKRNNARSKAKGRKTQLMKQRKATGRSMTGKKNTGGKNTPGA